ncbi:hypothetical protein [Parablautia sp. Marseille-Q6255]|uniref:hypothetical protein n=1 Tax=Parablautia sp. Marseille-Q6255 TaxID=3039593 RepID=UPI0024BCC306|nr:hypothetical protein [Parablautia sp. Marseille-Q6255]
MAVSTKRITDLPEKTEVTDEDLIAVGNAGTASLRKTKWSAFWNKILSKIRSDVIVNNKTTTAPGYALDARVGKDIQEQVNDLNTNMIYRPFVLSKWCNGGEQINLLVDVSKAEKRRLPIFIGGNIGGGSFLQMGLLDNLTASSTEIKFTAILISDSGLMRAYANLNNGSANMYRIMIQSASGMGQHIFVMIPAANVRLENTW